MTKRLLLWLAGPVVMLAGCATLPSIMGIPDTPAAVAETTLLDEQVGAGVELAYKAFRVALETATDAGLLKGDHARRAAVLDNQAFAAVGAVRAAYRAGNAADYGRAAKEARTAITAALAALGSK